MKLKFKFYAWTTPDDNYGISSWSLNIVPSIRIDYWKYKKGGGWFCIIFSWLIFGFTLDWRKKTKGGIR